MKPTWSWVPKLRPLHLCLCFWPLSYILTENSPVLKVGPTRVAPLLFHFLTILPLPTPFIFAPSSFLPFPTCTLSHSLWFSLSFFLRLLLLQFQFSPFDVMAKGGKLMRLKSVLKKWNSFGNGKQSRHSTSAVADDESSSRSDLHAVYVGKSRRLYRVSSGVLDNPVFRELVERSRDDSDQQDDTINVACEVVLFEHLLWMLENADPQPESLNELVDFYAC